MNAVDLLAAVRALPSVLPTDRVIADCSVNDDGAGLVTTSYSAFVFRRGVRVESAQHAGESMIVSCPNMDSVPALFARIAEHTLTACVCHQCEDARHVAAEAAEEHAQAQHEASLPRLGDMG